MIELRIQLDQAIAVVSGDDVKDVIEQAAFFSGLPKVCPVCGKGLFFTCRRPKGFVYYGMKCLGDPAHETSFGQAKEGGKLFYKVADGFRDAYAQDDDDDPAPARTPNTVSQTYQRRMNDTGEKCSQCNAPPGVPHATRCTA